MKKFLTGCLIVAALLLGAVIAGIVTLNLSFARASIEAKVNDLLGVRIDVDGDIHLRLGLTPTLVVESLGVRAGDSSLASLIEARELSASVDLISLLRGQVRLRQVVVATAAVNYCAQPPTVPDVGPSVSTLPSIAVDSLRSDMITIMCKGAGVEADMDAQITILALQGSAPATQAVELAARIQYADIDTELTVGTASLNTVLSRPALLPLSVHAVAMGDSIAVRGQVLAPFDEARLDTEFKLNVEDIRNWSSVTGLQVRRPLGVALEGQMQASLSGVDMRQASGVFVDTHFDLTASARLDAPRPHFALEARLDRFDAGLFLDPAQETDNRSGPPNLDFTALFEVMQSFDGRLRLHTGHLDGLPINIAAAMLSADLTNGTLRVRELNFSHQQVRLGASARLDTAVECPALKATISVDSLTSDMLAGFTGIKNFYAGFDRLEARTQSCGHSLLAHRDSLTATASAFDGLLRFDDAIPPLMIKSLQISSAWHGHTRLNLASTWQGESIAASADSGSIAALLASDRLPLAIEVDAAGGRLGFKGHMRSDTTEPNLSGDLQVSVPRLGTLAAWTDVRHDAKANLSLTSAVRLDDGMLTLGDLRATLGQSDISGRLRFNGSVEKSISTMQLHSRNLDLAELASLALAPEPTVAKSNSDRKSAFDLTKIKLPRIDFDLRADRVHLTGFDISKLTTRGRLREKLIDDARLAMQLEEIDLTGTLDLDLRGSEPVARFTLGASNVDIGRLLATVGLSEEVNARAERLDVEYATRGSTVRALVANARHQSEVRELRWLVKGANGRRLTELRFDELSMTTRPDAPTVWRASGSINDAPTRLWLETPSLPVVLVGNTTLPIKGALLIANDAFLFEATLRRDGIKLLGADISASGDTVDAETINLETFQRPLERDQVVARVSLDDGVVHVNDLVARINQSQITGKASFTLNRDQRTLTLDFWAPHVQTDNFLELAAAWRGIKQKAATPETGKGEATEDERQLIDVIAEALEELTESNAFDIDVDIGELYSGSDLLGAAEVRLIANSRELHLSPLKIAQPGSDLGIEYHIWEADDSVDVKARIYSQRFNYGGLLRLLDPESIATGLAYVDVELASTAPARADIRKNYQGHMDLMVIPKGIEVGLIDLWATNLFLAILPTLSESNRNKVNCLVTRFDVAESVMKTKNVMLDTTDVIVHGHGKIDLASRRLDLRFAPQAKRERFLSISTPISISGPWDDFQVRVGAGGVMMTALRLYYNLIYVPFRWLTGERFPADGLPTCFKAMGRKVTPEQVTAIRDELEQMNQ